jgi:cholestenol delta-isomerase
MQHPMRFPLQAMVSLGQIYGDVLYYATSMFDLYYKNLTYCRPEAYYFWFYFFFMNFIWIVIPGCECGLRVHVERTLTTLVLLYQSITTTSHAFKALARLERSLQGNGAVKKPLANGHVKKSA